MNDKIAIYLRLSLADGDLKKGSKDESNSIENQRMLLHDYIGKQEDLFGEIVEYVDDGYTGTNFNRPAFQKMIVDLKQGDIKVIMVKDLSRLGRDYIGVGDYIEQIFPLMGVRFIAVNNSFDSMKLNNGTPGIEVAVSNLVNNMYSRDIAKKIRAALETNWKNGKATCTNVPFGYVWNKKGGQRWEIDPEAAPCVKKVFELALSGRNTTQIAYGMNELNLPTPGLYVELLLNSVERCIAIRPCDKNNPNAIRWGRLKEGRWCASTLGCRGLAKTLFDIMEWDEDLRYRFRGQFLEQGDNKMMLFAFDEPEMIKVEEIVLPPKENTEEDEGETVKKKIYIFPPEWAGTFGQPITSIAQVGILRQEHYAGNWDVFRPATEIEKMNIFTAESLNELLREAEKIMEGWTDYR